MFTRPQSKYNSLDNTPGGTQKNVVSIFCTLKAHNFFKFFLFSYWQEMEEKNCKTN